MKGRFFLKKKLQHNIKNSSTLLLLHWCGMYSFQRFFLFFGLTMSFGICLDSITKNISKKNTQLQKNVE